MNDNRPHMSDYKKDKILSENNYKCFYCGEDATCVDHIIPYKYSRDDGENNLIASCSLCNHIAYDKVFDNLEMKKIFINSEQRKRRKIDHSKTKSICLDCGKPFEPSFNGSTLFYCRDCSQYFQD